MNQQANSGTQRQSKGGAILTAAVAATLAARSMASAQLIATDHFVIGATPANGEYAAAVLVSSTTGGQNPTIAGFTGPWAGNTGSGIAQWTSENTTLNTSVPSYESGGK